MQEYKGKPMEVPPEGLDGLRRKGLEILLYFKDICEKNNLKFYFCGGCCIGALRHGGFVPWDDDVDVFMPRDDYENSQKFGTSRQILKNTVMFAQPRTILQDF